ncbi:integrase, partial [Pseudomonas aeruginosa]|nr:integrase [Pseudomonas aeruginosa]
MNGIVQSIGSLYSSGQFPAVCEPEHASQLFGKPSPDFILCRDKDGNPTAVYGRPIWCFNAYRLSARKINRIMFNSVFCSDGPEQQALVDEVKYILFCLIYFAGGGRLGKLTASTLNQYWSVLRIAMRFCLEQKQKPMVGVLSLQQLFATPVYLAAFIQSANCMHDTLRGVLAALNRVGEERLGYAVLNPTSFGLQRKDSKQHPVIPTRIYLNLINFAGDLLDQLYEGVDRFEVFIACFSDEYYGIAHKSQRSRGVGGKAHWRPDMLQALKDHGLISIFAGEFACDYKYNLQRVLLHMQYLVKTVIHLYTGMRDQEVMRMPYHCLSEPVARRAIVDDQGVERDKQLTVNVLSTTTKFTGYKKEGAWLASSEVVKAVKVAQAICRGLAKLYRIELDKNCPLFLNPSIVGFTKSSPEVGVSGLLASRGKSAVFRSLTIQPEDLLELNQSDPSRDFYNELEFAVGQPWPLSSHQLRRSLAFYGASSGFLSLPTLRAQFKHMTIEMSRYYANSYENLRTIFGYYDKKNKEFVLPSNHFAFEYQMAMPMTVANQLIADLLLSEEPLFGGTGSYAEKQKERVKGGELQIEDVRVDTEQRVKNGSISYRPTLLGGCTKVGRCDSFMLGDYTECLSCEGAIIKPAKLNAAIEEATNELGNYAECSGEYQVVKGEIDRLTAFKARL